MLQFFSDLWLHEPDAGTVGRAATELSLPAADPADLAVAYTDLFLLNVYPYGTAFNDPSGELNGPTAQEAAALYEACEYRPSELPAVGAPDHLGLGLGFLAHLERSEDAFQTWRRYSVSSPGLEDFMSDLMAWAPVCCFSVEREPFAHPFYQGLAARTREALFWHAERAKASHPSGMRPFASLRMTGQAPEDEPGLRDFLRFLLAPARSGLFLSRTRLGEIAKALGARLPFGSRFEVAEALFATAGESGQVGELLERLAAEVVIWETAYREWAVHHPAWASLAGQWLERTGATQQMLAGMRRVLEIPLEIDYQESNG